MILIAGCSSLSGETRLTNPGRFESIPELQGVPFFPQEAWQCGPAALATIVSAASQTVEPSDLEPLLFIQDRKGTLQVELRGAARRLGFLSFAQEADLEALLSNLQAGYPTLVLQNLGLSWLPKWHYAVAVGFDAESSSVLLRSGRDPLRKTSLKEFSRTWQASKNWMMTVHPPEKIPQDLTVTDLLAEATGLERSGQREAALAAWQAAGTRWPDNQVVAMGEGNLHYQADDFAEAEAAYRRALAINPEHAAPHHNLAWALIRQQRFVEARLHAHRAVELSNLAAYASALEHLEGVPHVSD